MKTLKLKVVFVSPKNPRFAILSTLIETKLGNKTIVTRKGGFLESVDSWEMGEEMEVPENVVKFTTRKTSTGSELPVIELV